MGGDDVPLGREVAGAQGVEPCLRPFVHAEREDEGGGVHAGRAATLETGGRPRPALEARWLELTRAVLPRMAQAGGWALRHDHCFMRVCLDGALGRPWRERVRPPAYRNLSDAGLARAVALAEAVARDPALLHRLNADSLRLRRLAAAAREPAARLL